MIPASETFQRGRFYNKEYIARAVHPCSVRKFLNALKIDYLADGIVSGDDILDAMEARRNRLSAMRELETVPKTRRNGPRNALAPINAESILAARRRRA